MFAQLSPVSHPRVNWAVSYTHPTEREKSGRKKRIVRTFVQKDDALQYQREVNRGVAIGGVVGLALDEHARADMFSARQILDLAGVGMSLTDVARAFLSLMPKGAGLLLPPLLERFLDHKYRVENCRPRTVQGLKVRVGSWFAREGLASVNDLTRQACLALRDRGGAEANTRKNDMNAASSFLSWLVEEEIIATNPLQGIRRPSAGHGKREIWQAHEVRAWFEAAAKYRQGRFVPSLVALFFGGLRPGEQNDSRFCLTDDTPVLRAEGGKLQGRANRDVPLTPAACAWLCAFPPAKDGRFEPLTVKARAALAKAVRMKWKPDAPRHTFISARAAILQKDGQVAREAGTSEGVIYRHYLRRITRIEAEAIMAVAPIVKTVRKIKNVTPQKLRIGLN